MCPNKGQQTRETDDLVDMRRQGSLDLQALEQRARQARAEALRTLVRGAISWCRLSSCRFASRIARSPTKCGVNAPSVAHPPRARTVEGGKK
jgi:hypothetical protein